MSFGTKLRRLGSVARTPQTSSGRFAFSAPATLGCAGLSIMLGYLVATRGPQVALVLVVLPVAYYVGTHRVAGMISATALLLVVPYWYTIGTAQLAVLRIACLLALAGLLFARRVRLTWVDGAVLAVVTVTVFGWLLQNDQPQVGRAIEAEVIPFAFYVGARTLSPGDVPRVMRWILLAGTLGALTLIYEEVRGYTVFLDPNTYVWKGTATDVFRPGGIFGSPPGAATVLVITILCGFPAYRAATGWTKRAYAGCLVTSSVACVLTFTRANLISLVGAIAIYLILSRSRMISARRLFVASLVILVSVLWLLPTIERSSVFQSGIVRPGTFSARVGFWGLALPIATASPHNFLFGIGTDRTVIANQGGSEPASLASAPALFQEGTHNQYVLTLLEQGAVGLAALVTWLALTVMSSGRRAWATRDRIDAALCAGACSFAIDLFADNAMLHPPSLAMMALVSGLVVARSGLRSGTHSSLRTPFRGPS
jgi:O-antigen ligase